MERRDFYRIEDRIRLTITPMASTDERTDPYSADFPIPHNVRLLNQLNAIDDENRELQRQLSDQNRALGYYLRAMNDKIDLLAQHIVLADEALPGDQPVSLSEGGLSYFHDQPLAAGKRQHLVMVLLPQCTALACIASVKTCDQVDNEPTLFRIGLEFDILHEPDRKLIVRHIRRQETQLRQRSDPA